MSFVSHSFALSSIHFAILPEKQKQALFRVLSVQELSYTFFQNQIAVGGGGKGHSVSGGTAVVSGGRGEGGFLGL